MNFYAIIVAGGSGKRMQSALAKQFLLLNEKPVMMHTLQAFYMSTFEPELIVVLAKDYHDYWKELCITYNFEIPHTLIEGGPQRFHSVRNGLLTVKHDGVVAIHDAVRPLVSQKLINNAFKIATEHGNAVPFITPSDSVRQVKGAYSEIINRDALAMIQTPQVFTTAQLRTGYQHSYIEEFTDDASVVEAAGFPIHLIAGDRNNIKITYTEDLELASFLLGR